jgi:hypothetical protein
MANGTNGGVMKDKELTELIVRANRLGLVGTRVRDWIPPQKATDNPDGQFLLDIKPTYDLH